MTDTQRSVSDIITILADNSTQQISAQDMRDSFISWLPRFGQIYIANGDGASETIANTTDYVECTASTWTFSSGVAYAFDQSAGNGRLTYTGTVDMICLVMATVSFTTASSAQIMHWRLGLNGTTDPASEQIVPEPTLITTGLATSTLLTSMAPGDYISLWVRNESTATNVTPNVANIQILTVPLP